MSVSSENRQTTPKLGNGVWTDIAFTFKVFSTSEVVLVQTTDAGVDSTLVEGAGNDYTVTLNADQNTDPGGTITLTAVSVSGYYYTATSNVTNTQGVHITNLGGFFPSILNNALDRLTILVQQVLNKVNRSIKIPISDGTGFDTELLGAAARADHVLGFDSSGVPTVYTFGSISGTIDASFTALAENDFVVRGASAFVNKTPVAARPILGLLQAKGSTLASASTVDLGAADSDYVEISGTTTITSFGTSTAYNRVWTRFTGVLILTHHASNLILPGGANITTAAGDVAEWVRSSSGSWVCANYVRAASIPFLASSYATAAQGTLAAAALPVAKAEGFISGGVPSSAADADHDITFTAGVCISDDGTTAFAIPAYTKQFDTAFAAGDAAGGLDTGALPTSGTLYIYAIYNPSTEASDILGTTTSGSPTMPSGFTKKRLIHAVETDGSDNFYPHSAKEIAGGGLHVMFKNPPFSHNSAFTTAGGPYTIGLLGVPHGKNHKATINVTAGTASGQARLGFWNDDVDDEQPDYTTAPGAPHVASANGDAFQISVMTDTSGQIKGDAANANCNGTTVTCLGYEDARR